MTKGDNKVNWCYNGNSLMKEVSQLKHPILFQQSMNETTSIMGVGDKNKFHTINFSITLIRKSKQ